MWLSWEFLNFESHPSSPRVTTLMVCLFPIYLSVSIFGSLARENKGKESDHPSNNPSSSLPFPSNLDCTARWPSSI
ncbi:hypothetical protein BDQ94DRAFT_132392 [Aspergillus welwitschiae]|uniref:Uncharacterized protein n=1 Tax=Aspergillus welwitschiae TaxID=1341132 RepID=A0A3F3QIJ8_9EURO|nr:hypothetical protein BDQ94DRAFT_132392 [Aspergillus welwitschiae]RDH39108.1 hypothetical protein BDQ94DRAFT_132392 [Aspergillus welwitschiae]